MNKKILTILTVAILLASVAVVCASEDDHESTGVRYNAPDGYTFDQKCVVLNTNHETYDENGVGYIYKQGTKEVSVTIFDLKDHSATLDDIKSDLRSGYEEKTIGDIKGYLYDEGDSYSFDFIVNGKYVYINAPSVEIIEEMLS